MKIQIKCPYCEFTTDIPEERIPPQARYANCPKCRQKFPITRQSSAPEHGDTAPLVRADREGPLSSLHTEYNEIRIPTPWEDRSRINLWKAIYKTMIHVAFKPVSTFRTMRHQGGLKDPLAFGLLFGTLGMMFSIFWDFMLTPWGLGGGFASAFSSISTVILFPALMALAPLFVIIYMFIFTCIIHIFLLLVRGGGNGFEATFRVVAYGQVTQLLGAVPLAGGFVAGLWLLVIEIIGLKEIHKTTYVRVLFAIFIPIILLVLIVALVAIALSLAFLR